MPQTSSHESSEAYTVVIFRGSTAKPIRLNFPRKLVRTLTIICCVLLLADFLVISHYVMRTKEVWELAAFRAEAMSAREQTAAFSSAVEDLKKRLVAMKEVNQRLRVMLGIEVPQTGDMVNGRGGEDVPLPEGGQAMGGGLSEVAEPAAGSPRTTLDGEAKHDHSAVIDADYLENSRLASSVKESLEWLSKEATVQEQILSELSQAAEQRSSRWAATPSIWPVKGWVTSGFGPRISPFTEKLSWHDGLDIGAAPNAPVQATAQGRVILAAYDPKLGNIVKLDHGFGIETLYGHLAKSLVKEGQRVNRGDVVGLVGSTGLSTGPHLHYMVKVNGQTLDPRKYILE
ncbi:MAG: M23 family metallopeptidase [Nitrospira sp.]|nr:M23 family metallopeptidase [Nitrospira sp.]MCP9462114.1 M23 family metallopeptidase [Nitrospira sp.]